MSFIHDKNKPRKGIQIGGEYEESESSDKDPQTETQNSVDILSDLKGEGERSEIEKPNFTTPLETEKLRIQKASASNAPRSLHCENKFTTTKRKTKKKNNINMEQDNEKLYRITL
ncbi:uncharacterized protein LOC126897725 [Daktulosphaira vitifoliae]|uniref:uncharacterized protein LOC126897725 n=1 Tax=Daktulosphaira vitifoliae TaxID=58002 RepID=UPI0021AA29AD|nr:uncharacterized protein LOC126897725 [Daktulosphaira vitifoliae]